MQEQGQKKQQYILLPEHLEEKAAAKLGEMNDASFSEFSQRVQQAAQELGITNARLAVVRYLPPTINMYRLLDGVACFVSNEEVWLEIQNIRKPSDYPQPVYLIDGDKYMLPTESQ